MVESANTTKRNVKKDAFVMMMQSAKKPKSPAKNDASAVMVESINTLLDFDLLKAEDHVHNWDAPVSQEEADQASYRIKEAAINLRLSKISDPFLEYCTVWVDEDSDQMSEFNQDPEFNRNPEQDAEFPQDPMPPPTTEPSAKAYLKDIRVHFAPNKDDDTTQLVQGFTLRYSDGVQKVVGNIRGTKSRGSIQLDPYEHLVGIDQLYLDYRTNDRTVSVLFYISHPAVGYFLMEVTSDGIERDCDDIWLESEIQSKAGHVIKSIEFSEIEQKITGIQEQKKPMTKNEPYDELDHDHDRPDSLSCEAGDRPFADLEKCRPKRGPRNIAQYLYLVPLKARPALKKLQQEFRMDAWDLLFRKVSTYDWFEKNYRGPWQKIRDQAEKLLGVTPVARNIKKLENVMTKIQYGKASHFTEKDKNHVSALICKEVKNLNETRIPLISSQACMRTEKMEATLIQDFRDFVKHKRAQKMALVESFLSRLAQFSTKHKIQRRLQVCYQPYCWNIFDPSLVPEWKRCTADGCADHRQTCGCAPVYLRNSHDYYCETHNEIWENS